MINAQFHGFLNTSPLWIGEEYDIQQFSLPTFPSHSLNPKPIPLKIRFGHQMEYVFKQLVEHSNAYHLVLHNLQISQGKRTLGEIDFILKDLSTGKLIHVELTYKFYIIDPEVSDPTYRLVGPNRRDLFMAKMKKIKQVQFPLLHSEFGSKALAERHIDHSKVEHQCCFKAQLFYPLDNEMVNIGPLNRECSAGHWLRVEDFNSSEFQKAKFYMPSKSEWVIHPMDQVTWRSHSEIMKDINRSLLNEMSPMIWMRNSNAQIVKLFVVWW